MKLLLVGGGGHCRSVIDSLNKTGFDNIGIIDKEENKEKNIYGVPYIGSDENFQELRNKGYTHAIITVGSIGNTEHRKRLQLMLSQYGYQFFSVVDSSSIVSEHASIGQGCFVGKGAIINAGVVISDHCIINSGVVLDHDVRVESFVHIAPGSSISGGVKISSSAHIGTGSSVIQGISVGCNTIVGAGSVVLSDLPDAVVAYGNPCKIVRRRED